MHEEWKLETSEAIGSYRVFDLYRDVRRHPAREAPHTFYRLAAADWVNVIPLTDGGEVVLVRQFRAGVEAETLEIPGGIVDPGETPRAAAERELLEETGFCAREVQPLGVVHPNPALFTNRCHTFVARGVRSCAEQRLDDGEAIRVERVPLARVPALLSGGQITHALVVSAFYWLFAREGFPSRVP